MATWEALSLLQAVQLFWSTLVYTGRIWRVFKFVCFLMHVLSLAITHYTKPSLVCRSSQLSSLAVQTQSELLHVMNRCQWSKDMASPPILAAQ